MLRGATASAPIPPSRCKRRAALRSVFAGAVLLLASCVGPTHETRAPRVDPTTLTGKVMVGYQGWFNAEGDGAKRGYNHWTRGGARPAPGNIRVDMWPDLSEFPAAERFPTDLVHADGSRAEVFSSILRPTVVRHFSWMREHGIDGVFLQRFINSLSRGTSLAANNAVLENVRAGAREHGRVYALMYDLSSLAPGQADVLIDEWKKLLRDTQLTRDPAYLRHHGKPLLALWGCGFKDDKPRPTLDDWRKILTFLKSDKESGGLALMIGVPSYWRTLTRDAVADSALLELIQLADVISPWTPGRYRTPETAATHAATVWQPDIAWCRGRKIDFLPVAFPGFSWHNMKPEAPLNAIPRLGGRFFWSQIAAAKRAGADMLYVAMFDEVDEATAIFKVTNTPPTGPGENVKFVTYEGLPSDHYLRLTSLAGKLLRGEIPVTDDAAGLLRPVSP